MEIGAKFHPNLGTVWAQIDEFCRGNQKPQWWDANMQKWLKMTPAHDFCWSNKFGILTVHLKVLRKWLIYVLYITLGVGTRGDGGAPPQLGGAPPPPPPWA